MVNRLFLSNLPIGISEDQLRRNLVRDFEEFRMANRAGTLNITLFTPKRAPSGKMRQTGIITGFEVNFEDLIRRAANYDCSGRDWAFKKDRGDARNPDGSFVTPLTAANRRLYDSIEGRTHRPVWLMLDDMFYRSIECAIERSPMTFTFLGNYFASEVGAMQALRHDEGTIKLKYSSRLDCCQQIALWNGRRITGTTQEVTFCNSDGTKAVHFQDQLGFGVEFQRLDITALQKEHGYVPLEMLNDNLFAKGRARNMKSLCWRCEQPYRIVGVDSDLRYVAGKCSCSYDSNLDIMSKERAFFHSNERFTRLIHGRKEESGLHVWVISHAPMQTYYEDAIEYRNTMAPILLDNWKVFSNFIKETNTCEGVISSSALVDSEVNDNGTVINRFALAILVDRTDFYYEGNAFQIGGLTLQFFIQIAKGQTVFVKRKAKVCSIRQSDIEGQVVIYAHVMMEAESTVNLGYVHIVPKPTKLDYESTRRSLAKLAKGKLDSPFQNMILNPSSDTLKEEIQLPQERTWGFNASKDFRLARQLNEEQKNARHLAFKTALSIILGPPGTGKTYTLGAIAASLVYKEQGVLLAVCPSNYACDNIAASVARQFTRYADFGEPKRVLRVFSKKREEEMMRTSSLPNLGNNVDILHDIVRRQLVELNDDDIKSVLEKYARGENHLITKDEMELFNKIVDKLQKKLFNTFKVIVCTIGCLCDQRILSWNKTAKKVQTIVVDEAAFLLQTSLVTCLEFNPKRIILAGDPYQLQAIVHSYPASLAGLVVSGMEFLQRSNAPLAWTTLKEQFRMAPDIREVVSNVTYRGELRDADSVTVRYDRLFPQIAKLFRPPLKSSILVYDHSFQETKEKEDKSCSNPEEATLAANLCEQLITHGVATHDIVVLTFYEQQRKLIFRLVEHMNVRVNTVDSFQGKKCPYVILSFVRGNEGSVGFVAEENRLNVAISRAQDLLICLINMTCFRAHGNRALAKFCSALDEKADIRKA